MLNRDYDYDEDYEVDDDTLIKRFCIKIGVLLAIAIVCFTVYGIVFYDFTPFLIMGFLLLPVIVYGVKIIWENVKADVFEE